MCVFQNKDLLWIYYELLFASDFENASFGGSYTIEVFEWNEDQYMRLFPHKAHSCDHYEGHIDLKYHPNRKLCGFCRCFLWFS